MKRAKQDYNIQAVANAFRVLQEFKRDQPEWGISDLGRNLALHKNAVFRILATLEAMGYVEQNPEKETYRLSVQCLELGRAFLRHTSLTHASMGRLESLRDQVGESCYLGILAEEEVLYLEGAQSDHVLHVASRVGKRLPVYCTAIGKVLLAFTEPARQKAWLESLSFEPWTSRTLRNRDEFKAQLEQIRRQGYSLDQGEKNDGVVGVAAPLRDHEGKVVAGLSILGPSVRMSEEALHTKLLPALINTAEAISKAMGFQGRP